MIYSNIINNLDGWCSESKIQKMYDLIIQTKPLHLVEIGVFGGKSILTQAFALKDNDYGVIHGIDSWEIGDCISNMTDQLNIDWWNKLDLANIYNGCVTAIKKNQLEKYIVLHKMSSKEYNQLIDFQIDILHIDGNHEELHSCADVELYLPKVKSNGYIWFDDANWYQTKKAVDLIENKYKCVLIDDAQSNDPGNLCNLYMKP